MRKSVNLISKTICYKSQKTKLTLSKFILISVFGIEILFYLYNRFRFFFFSLQFTFFCCSFITAIELLGNPAEMYSHGSQFWMICLSFILIVPLTSKLYLPVFMKLRLTSSYEYLAIRFNAVTSLFASGLYALQMILYTSVAVYAPALALSHGENNLKKITKAYYIKLF